MNKTLVILLCFALILRLVTILFSGPAILTPQAQQNLDAFAYNQLAVSLMNGNGFINGEGRAFRPPLYPFFLAAVYLFTGVENFIAVRVVQTIVSTATVGLLFLLARKMAGQRAGMIAAVMSSIYPYFVYFVPEITSETLFLFLFVLAILLLCWGRDPLKHFLAGVALGLSALCRSNVLIFAPFAAIWVLLKDLLNKTRAFKLAILYLLGLVLVVAPWLVRNYIVLHGEIVPISTNSGFNMALGFSSRSQHLSLPQADSLLAKVPTMGLSEAEADRFYRSSMIAAFVSEPILAAHIALRKVVHFWSPFVRNQGVIVTLMGFLAFVPVVVLAFAGTLGCWNSKANRDLLVLFFFNFLSASGQAALTLPNIRLWIPMVDPLLIVLAGAGVAVIYSKWSDMWTRCQCRIALGPPRLTSSSRESANAKTRSHHHH